MNNRFGTTVIRVVSVFALAAGMVGASQAAPVTVDGTFTSFTSWILDPAFRPSVVNGIPLTSSGTVVGNSGPPNNFDYFMSNTVTFTAPTPTIDFILTCSGFCPNPPLVNTFQFTPGAADVVLHQEFQLGTFSFTNGGWFPQADIGFRLTSHSTEDPLLDGHTFEGTLRLVVNQDLTLPFDPYEEADFFYVLEEPALGSARVFDLFRLPPGTTPPGNVGPFAYDGKIGSLIPTGFRALNDNGFTSPSIQTGPLNPIPEPETYALLLAGLGLLGFMARRRKQQEAAAA